MAKAFASSSDRPVITFVSKQRLTGANNGSSAYLLAIARSLHEAGFELHLLQPSPTVAGRSPSFRIGDELNVFTRHDIRGARRWGSRVWFSDLGLWKAAFQGVLARLGRAFGLKGAMWRDRPAPYSVATPWLEADFAFLRRKMDPATKAVIADYMFCHPAFTCAPEGARSAIIMHDLFHARGGEGKDSVTAVSAEDEIAMLAQADTVFAIQQGEAAFFKREVPSTQPLLVPMPAAPGSAPQPGRSDRLLMVGSNTAPNIEGLRDFLANAWPKVHAARPDAQLQVAGTMGRAFVGESWPNVEFLGIVDSLDPLYAQAGLVLSPLTFGSGLKIKLIEGMANGKAMVVSSVTLQGVEEICGPGVALADTGEEAADHIVRLLGEETQRTKLAEAALDIARAHFTAEAVHAELREWAEELRS